jgi:hypothetical protein
MTANVIIRKEKIKIYTSDEQLALRVRKQLNDTLQYDLIAMMEKVFAKTASSDLYINIDKLKIDLGVVNAQDFEQHFIKLVESKMINELRKQVCTSLISNLRIIFLNYHISGIYFHLTKRNVLILPN